LIARLQCGEACFGEIDITDNVAALNHGEWTRLAIDLKCFAQAEMDFSKVSTPFSLATSGMLGLAFGNVVYEANAQKNADISC
jgi:beta-glucosidase